MGEIDDAEGVRMIGIRAAETGEASAIAQLVVDSYAEFQDRLTAGNWAIMQTNLRRAVLDPGRGQPLVATVDGALGGFILYFPPGRSDGVLFPEAWASIRLLGVAPAMRGHGLGKALVEECLRRARAEGAQTFGLHTSELMKTARAMYERMGFTVVRELEPRLGVRYWLFQLGLARAD